MIKKLLILLCVFYSKYNLYANELYSDSCNYLLMQSRKNPKIYNYVLEGSIVKIVDTTYYFSKGKLVLLNDSIVGVQNTKNDSIHYYHVGQIYMIKYNNKTRKKGAAYMALSSIITGIIAYYYNEAYPYTGNIISDINIGMTSGLITSASMLTGLSSLILINKRALLTKFRNYKKIRINTNCKIEELVSEYLKVL